MTNCPACGALVADDARYCSQCGTTIGKESAVEIARRDREYEIRRFLSAVPVIVMGGIGLGAGQLLLPITTDLFPQQVAGMDDWPIRVAIQLAPAVVGVLAAIIYQTSRDGQRRQGGVTGEIRAATAVMVN